KLAEHQQHHGEAHYYSVRSQLETDPILRAARFIYLNKTCYNGLRRRNFNF
ncbi:MAG: DNA adenine methylase, partial [Pseudomonadota bacterium]